MPKYPDGMLPSRANQFATSIVGSTSTGPTAVDFGFGASLMKFIVNSGGPVYLQFNGNPATTNDYQLSSGDLLTDWYDFGVQISGFSFTPGTSTVLSVRMGAWG